MDPDANLKAQLDLVAEMSSLDSDLDYLEFESKAQGLIDLVLALDLWLSRGGFLPKRWCEVKGN